MSALAEQSETTTSLDRLLSSIDVSPDRFLQPSALVQTASLLAAKRILDPVVSEYSVFRELALNGLDVDQVWEQIRLVGDQVKSVLEKQKDLKTFDAKAVQDGALNHVRVRGRRAAESDSSIEEDELETSNAEDTDVPEDEDEERDEWEDEDDEDEGGMIDDEFPANPERDESSEDENDGKEDSLKRFKGDVHGLNDAFFSIDDFNRLTEQQDNEGSEDEEVDEIDYFANPDEQGDDSDDERPDDVKYTDFYLPPPNSTSSRKRKRASFEDRDGLPHEDELDDDARVARFQKDLFADASLPVDPSAPSLSTYAQRKAAIKAEVEKLEQENIAEKEWMYIGEASSRDRPKNSLLEVSEELDVERSTKPVPVITEERTSSLEEIIKQRIISNNFDDVKRKLPPALTQNSRTADDDPDMQDPGVKSTRGLAEVYEKEYLRRIDPANNPTPLALSKQKEHTEIEALWKDLSHQLDCLTSMRFIPAPEIVGERIVADIPAVDMEDARPEAEAGATMLAPQEVYRPEAKKGEIVVGGIPVARVEMTREGKVRARKREGKKREKKKVTPLEGSRKDVIDTLKKGGVKIISQGRGKSNGQKSKVPSRGGRVES